MSAHKDSAKKGFTLIELMVVIAIIAILASIGMVVYSGLQKNARLSKRIQDLQAIKLALETYKSAVGNYPNAASEGCISTTLTALVPNYMPVLPLDPSGGTNCYIYKSNAASASSDYKVRTSNTEMTTVEYSGQPNYIDPRRDGGATDDGTNCDTAISTSNITAWAVYTTGGRCY